jgi:predicted nucleic acid-binding protein
MRVVTNTSPVLYLFQIGQLSLLERLYGRIIAPQAVINELAVGRQQGYEVPDCGAYKWMVVETVPSAPVLRLVTALGAGEAEALALALALSEPTDLVLLDDGLARQIAASHGVRVTGTIGVLLQSKQQGLIGSVTPALDRLQQAGFYMTDALKVHVLRTAGESSETG